MNFVKSHVAQLTLLFLLKKNPEFASEVRSINLCNVLYKIFLKVLANRLKKILPCVRAYNRVEWPYLQLVLEKMGFIEHWISLMMLSVKTVIYFVLVNGEPKGMITPTRGISRLTEVR